MMNREVGRGGPDYESTERIHRMGDALTVGGEARAALVGVVCGIGLLALGAAALWCAEQM
jgi:hypothetical protein